MQGDVEIKMISFSGIDCGGKSTQMEKLHDFYLKHNVSCKMIHSRGGYTPLLEFVKKLVRHDKGDHSEDSERARKEIHGSPRKRKILLWLSILDLSLYYGIWFRLVELFGTTILADRYLWDSYIDFKMKYVEIDFERWFVWKLAVSVCLKPEHSLIYTIPAEVSIYRSTLKEEPWPEPIEVRRERIDWYMKEIANSRWQHVIDATSSINDVFVETLKAIGL
jgi:dTMP kinase